MEGIPTGSLRAEGAFGISQILDFSMKEYLGEHSQAILEGTAQLAADGHWEFEGMIGRQAVELYAEGAERPVYSGIIQEAEAWEENGVHRIRLSLASGSILLDMEKKSRSFQDTAMTYGQVISQTLAMSGVAAVYPAILDQAPIGFPVIQYQETDWEFMKRIASRFHLSIYPEPEMSGAKLYFGIPVTGDLGTLDDIGYTSHVDARFFEMGGGAAGYSRNQFVTYDVVSWDNYRVGDQIDFKENLLYICGKSCKISGGQLEFTYILANPDWAGNKRRSNEKISGMSLLGTVVGCERETLRLLLDIDAGYPEQSLYAWTWVPTTGNVMYMMPQAGTRVSLYFKGAEESSAIAVNCIRSGNGCAGANYRDKTLTTEHGMQLRLCECDMGVVTLSNEVKMDNLRGINLKASGDLNITATGDVSFEAPLITIYGEKGVEAYEGPVIEIDEGVFDVDVRAKVVLSAGEAGVGNVDYRGAEKTYFLAWSGEDLSDDSFRFRDAPEDGYYDWAGLVGNVTGGIAVGVGAGIIVYIGVGALAAGSAKAAALMSTAKVTAGSFGASTALMATGFTMSTAISDVMNGRVSSTEEYIRRALAGSVVGFLAGASALARAGMGAGGSMAVGVVEGAAGSAASQWIINGAIKMDQVVMDGAFSGLVELGMWNWRNAVKGTGINNVYDDLMKQTGLTANQLDDIMKYLKIDIGDFAQAVKSGGLEALLGIPEMNLAYLMKQTGKSANEIAEWLSKTGKSLSDINASNIDDIINGLKGSGKIPEYNQDAYKAMQDGYEYYKSGSGYDCSEIAEDLYNAANGDGKVYRITPKEGNLMIGEEFGIPEKWYYHEVYSDGYYIFDPMFSEIPMLKDDYFRMLNGQLNNSNLLIVETVPYSIR